MLREFLLQNRGAILERAQGKASKRTLPKADEEDLQGIPLFFDQLIEALPRELGEIDRNGSSEIRATATTHGLDLQRRGFSTSQVVHAYGDICQSVTELAGERVAPIGAGEFHTFNRCLDVAIAEAVTAFQRQREEELSGLEVERLGFLAHELRNALSAAMLAFQMLKSGTSSIGGTTGGVLERSLVRLRELIDRSLAEVRLGAGTQLRSRIEVRDLIQEVEATAGVQASVRAIHLQTELPSGLEVVADRQLLTSAVGNLLDNALKFTRPDGTVTVRAKRRADRVLIEVADECGGLSAAKAAELFQPFVQRGSDRTGMGLGLALSRRAVEVNGGHLDMRQLPGKGCVFTVDLPLAPPNGSPAL
jgi:signal transduction histidine kinase